MNKFKDWIKTSKGKSIAIISVFALIIIVGAIVPLFVTNKDNKTPKKIFSNKQEIEIKKAENPGLTFEEYDGGFFTVSLPKGWKIETAGEYVSFGFKAYDPNEPNRQIFYYGRLEPFMKSEQAKKYFTDPMFRQAPVLNPATAEELFNQWPKIQSYSTQMGVTHTFPKLNNLKVLEKLPYSTPMSGSVVNEGMIRATFTGQNSKASEGLFASSIAAPGTYNVFGVDTAPMKAYTTIGISAGKDEFLYLEADLAKSLSSFKLSDSYVQQGIAQSNAETQAILNSIKTLSQASESYNKAWSERQTTYDVISQKNSDATLGYDRVIDTTTGEIYKAETGFYDTYSANKDDYENQNLELVTDNQDYLKAVDGYIYK